MTAPAPVDPNLAPGNNARLKAALLLNFVVLAILLNSVGAVALHVQRAYGVSESSAGWLGACKSLGIGAASFLAALQLTRFGYRRTMLVSLAGLVALCALVPAVPDFAMMKVLFGAAGAGFALIKVSVYASVGLVTADRRSHASFMSFLESGFTLGIVAGSLLFSAFIDEAHPQSVEWLRVFYLIAGLGALAWLLLWCAPLDESRVTQAPRESWRQRLSLAGDPALSRTVLTFGACVFFYVLLEQSIMNWLPTFNRKVFHLPAWLSIQMAGLLTIAMVFGRVLAGLLLRQVRWLPLLAGSLLAAAGVVCLALTLAGKSIDSPVTGWADAPLGVMIFPLVGLFIAPVFPVINSVMLSAVPVSRHGAMSGLGVIFSSGGSALGTLGLGILLQRYGGRQAFYFTLIPIAGLLVGLALFHRRTGRMKPPLS